MSNLDRTVNPTSNGVKLEVNLGGVIMKNPVTTASGCFGFGQEYDKFIDITRLGAVTVKGLTLLPREGNPPPRLVETTGGILNAIGLQNPGVDRFVQEYLPYLRELGIPVIVNISGNTPEEYGRLADRLSRVDGVAGLEVNISCPNVKQGGLMFGSDPALAGEVTAIVKGNTSLPVIVKLSPNVTDITAIARAVAQGGADALSLINTLLGMAIDIKTQRPVLGNVFGGLSGPAVKPVALRMVWQVARAVDLPILGMGGIMTAADAIEFILAGATAVAIGTGNFINPRVTLEVVAGIADYCRERGIADINELVGAAWKKGGLG